MSENTYWSLFCEVSNKQIDGLTTTQVKGIVSIFAKDNIENIMAWHEGLADWKKLKEFSSLFGQGAGASKAPPAPRKGSKKVEAVEAHTITEFSDEATMIRVGLLNKPFVDQRLNRRFKKNWPVEVMGPRGVFRTSLQDISLGGMQLQDLAPSECGTRFTVRIKRGECEHIDVVCQVVPTAQGDRSARLRVVNTDHETALRHWILGTRDAA